MVHQDVVIVPDDQPTKAPDPRERALDDPTSSVAAERATILRLRPVGSVRRDELDPTIGEPRSMSVAVIGLVSDHALRSRSGSATPSPRNTDHPERLLKERDLRRRGRVQVASQRNTLAVDHHHPLRTLSPLGATDSSAPPFAGAKLASTKDSLHLIRPRRSSSLKNARHMLSQTPASSHCRSRRQHVDPLGYPSGRSRHRAPVFKTQRIPSNTSRLSIHGRPPLRLFGSRGSCGSIFDHCLSVTVTLRFRIPPPPKAEVIARKSQPSKLKLGL